MPHWYHLFYREPHATLQQEQHGHQAGHTQVSTTSPFDRHAPGSWSLRQRRFCASLFQLPIVEVAWVESLVREQERATRGTVKPTRGCRWQAEACRPNESRKETAVAYPEDRDVRAVVCWCPLNLPPLTACVPPPRGQPRIITGGAESQTQLLFEPTLAITATGGQLQRQQPLQAAWLSLVHFEFTRPRCGSMSKSRGTSGVYLPLVTGDRLQELQLRCLMRKPLPSAFQISCGSSKVGTHTYFPLFHAINSICAEVAEAWREDNGQFDKKRGAYLQSVTRAAEEEMTIQKRTEQVGPDDQWVPRLLAWLSSVSFSHVHLDTAHAQVLSKVTHALVTDSNHKHLQATLMGGQGRLKAWHPLTVLPGVAVGQKLIFAWSASPGAAWPEAIHTASPIPRCRMLIKWHPENAQEGGAGNAAVTPATVAARMATNAPAFSVALPEWQVASMYLPMHLKAPGGGKCTDERARTFAQATSAFHEALASVLEVHTGVTPAPPTLSEATTQEESGGGCGQHAASRPQSSSPWEQASHPPRPHRAPLPLRRKQHLLSTTETSCTSSFTADSAREQRCTDSMAVIGEEMEEMEVNRYGASANQAAAQQQSQEEQRQTTSQRRKRARAASERITDGIVVGGSSNTVKRPRLTQIVVPEAATRIQSLPYRVSGEIPVAYAGCDPIDARLLLQRWTKATASMEECSTGEMKTEAVSRISSDSHALFAYVLQGPLFPCPGHYRMEGHSDALMPRCKPIPSVAAPVISALLPIASQDHLRAPTYLLPPHIAPSVPFPLPLSARAHTPGSTFPSCPPPFTRGFVSCVSMCCESARTRNSGKRSDEAVEASKLPTDVGVDTTQAEAGRATGTPMATEEGSILLVTLRNYALAGALEAEAAVGWARRVTTARDAFQYRSTLGVVKPIHPPTSTMHADEEASSLVMNAGDGLLVTTDHERVTSRAFFQENARSEESESGSGVASTTERTWQMVQQDLLLDRCHTAVYHHARKVAAKHFCDLLLTYSLTPNIDSPSASLSRPLAELYECEVRSTDLRVKQAALLGRVLEEDVWEMCAEMDRVILQRGEDGGLRHDGGKVSPSWNSGTRTAAVVFAEAAIHMAQMSTSCMEADSAAAEAALMSSLQSIATANAVTTAAEAFSLFSTPHAYVQHVEDVICRCFAREGCLLFYSWYYDLLDTNGGGQTSSDGLLRSRGGTDQMDASALHSYSDTCAVMAAWDGRDALSSLGGERMGEERWCATSPPPSRLPNSETTAQQLRLFGRVLCPLPDMLQSTKGMLWSGAPGHADSYDIAVERYRGQLRIVAADVLQWEAHPLRRVRGTRDLFSMQTCVRYSVESVTQQRNDEATRTALAALSVGRQAAQRQRRQWKKRESSSKPATATVAPQRDLLTRWEASTGLVSTPSQSRLPPPPPPAQQPQQQQLLCTCDNSVSDGWPSEWYQQVASRFPSEETRPMGAMTALREDMTTRVSFLVAALRHDRELDGQFWQWRGQNS